MKNQKQTPNLKCRPFKSNYYPRIKRIHTEPRQHIRQLLRSFIPLNTSQNQPGNDQQLTR